MAQTPIPKEKLKEAVELFGDEAVNTAIQLVEVSDPDGAWAHMTDVGDFECAEAIEFLYFSDCED